MLFSTPKDLGSRSATVGFHNFNLRIFNLRVSNPNKLIVDVFLTRCRISMCQGSRPVYNDEISEIDRKNDSNTANASNSSSCTNAAILVAVIILILALA